MAHGRHKFTLTNQEFAIIQRSIDLRIKHLVGEINRTLPEVGLDNPHIRDMDRTLYECRELSKKLSAIKKAARESE
jgi:hypothetical protein